MISSSYRHHCLRGFSLLEMIVVLTLLASLLAITLPAVFRPLGNSGLRGAAKQVQSALLEARTRAIESGVPQEFRYEPGGRAYEIRSRRDEDSQSGGAAAGLGAGKLGANVAEALKLSTSGTPGTAGDLPESVRDLLPDGIVFADPQETTATSEASLPSPPPETSASDNMTAARDAMEEQLNDEKWSPPLRFYSNGRGGNALLKLRDTNSWSIQVLFRGLVGAALIGEPRHEETNPQAAPGASWPATRVPASR